jgi:hypothetical protein
MQFFLLLQLTNIKDIAIADKKNVFFIGLVLSERRKQINKI